MKLSEIFTRFKKKKKVEENRINEWGMEEQTVQLEGEDVSSFAFYVKSLCRNVVVRLGEFRNRPRKQNTRLRKAERYLAGAICVFDFIMSVSSLANPLMFIFLAHLYYLLRYLWVSRNNWFIQEVKK